jgi:hypothetical protein
MKMSKRNLGIIIAAAIVIVGVVLLISKNNSPKPTAVSPAQIPSPAVSASPEAKTIGITAAERAKVRADFISDCVKTLGYGSSSQCSCAADYLAAHYSDADLAKLYVQYHSSGKIPEAVKTAVTKACPSK